MGSRTIGFLSFVILLAALAANAQQTAPALGANVSEHKLASGLMDRDMPYRVITPVEKMVAKDSRYPVIYMLHGLTGHFNNWTDLTKLSDYASTYKVIIVTPEGGDGWYTDSVSNDKEKWESYIVQELIAEVDKKFRTNTGRNQRAIAGLSMGGFGALKFGLKYPDKFMLAGSFSGALGAAQITEKTVPGAIGKTIDGIFGPADSEWRKANDLFAIIRSISPEKMKEMPFIYFDCGTEDFLFQSNREFVSLLVEKKVPHEYRQLPGIHDWKYWDKQVQEFLRLADRMFSK
ncbi:MAG: alpha/beta hydrolase family protein [Pyrinomonadaceae bacterium]